MTALHHRLLPVALLLLSGCASWFIGEDNAAPPAVLEPIDASVTPQILWRRQVGGDAEGRLRLVPALAGERIYTAAPDGGVRAFDRRDGRELWRSDIDAPVSGGPGVADGLVLVGTRDAELIALDAETGAERWRAPVSAEVLSVPRVAAGVVVCHAGDGRVSGHDADDGRELWAYQASPPVLTLHGSSSPAIHRERAFIGTAAGKLVALGLHDGRELWDATITVPSGRSELERMVDIDADPVVAGGAVFVVGYQGELAAVAEETGVVYWRRKLSSYSGLALTRDGLFVSDAKGHLWGIEPRNAAALWRQEALHDRRLSAPAIQSGLVVVGDLEGYLHWLRPGDGSLAGRVQFGSMPIHAAPVVADGVAYVLNGAGELAAFAIERTDR